MWKVMLALATAGLIVSSTASTAADGWTLEVQTDELTDVPRYVLFSESIKKTMPQTGIVVVCSNGQSAVSFLVGLTGVGDTFTVQYRFDKEQSGTVRAKPLGGQLLAVMGGDAPTLIAKMKKARQLYFRAKVPIDLHRDGTVSLVGFAEKLAKFEEHCG